MSAKKQTSEDVTKLLAGVVVLDLSRVLAGPWATQFLGDLGAEVIKIERPGRGDDTRQWGPPFVRSPNGGAGDAAYFQCANRNKKSVGIDFSKSEGAAAVRAIAKKAHILVENFKVGDLARKGLDYQSIASINPGIVYCSITGFGQSGPHSGKAGYDFMIQAMAGLMSVTGQPEGEPGIGPTKVGVAVSDIFAGMYAAASILAALRHAERTGKGQHIDVALFDCQVATLANQASNYLTSGHAPTRLGNAHPSIAPYESFFASDQPFILAVGNDSQFTNLCRAIGAPELADDARFSTNPVRVVNRNALRPALEPLLMKKTARQWLEILANAGVPAGPINSVDVALADPQISARNLLEGDASDIGSATPPFMRHPVKYSSTPAHRPSRPPELGADTDEILHSFLTSDEIAALKSAGASE
ncbi:MAG: CoA transferase [Alphaproteobacteria bacterium]|nr:CoA transferase [Alphaproteobacteria bacterium]